MVNGFSRNRIFISLLVTLYNIMFTTLQSFLPILTEHRGLFDSYTMIDPHLYFSTFLEPHFTVKHFWWWICTAILHGSIIFYICMNCFKQETYTADDKPSGMEVRVTSVEEQSTLIYTLILHVVFFKLSFELDRVS